MSNHSYAHETLAWIKQRLDDADTMISEAEKTAKKLQVSAREEADAALARLKAQDMARESGLSRDAGRVRETA